jgi:hypothetical protein
MATNVFIPPSTAWSNPEGTLPPPPTPAQPNHGGGVQLKTEVPSGSLPGTVFTVVNTPTFITVNGVMQFPGTDYTISNLQITFLSYTVQTTDTLLSWYA